jgi:hypothetical protein
MSAILFDSFSEVKPFLGSGFSDMSLETLESYLNNSKPEIKIVTGSDLLETLIENYDNSDMSAAEEALLPFIRKPLVAMTFYKFSMQGSLNIGDNGFVAEETETTKRPYQWQMKNFQRQCLADYASGMKDLYEHLLANVLDFPDWEDTEEFLFLKQVPINLFMQWPKSGRRIADWRTHYALIPEMKMVWDDLENKISTALWNDLNDELISGLTENNETLMTYIRRYVAHATIDRATLTLPLSIEADGIIVKEVESTSANSDTVKQISDKAALQKQAKDEANKAFCRLIKFLNSNADETLYSGYYSEFIENNTGNPTLNNDGDKLIFL